MFARTRVLALAASLLLACSFTVPQLDPTPSITATPQPKSMAFVVAPAVPDRFALSLGDDTTTVESWRESLEAGFRNGFQKVYPVKPTGAPDLTLQIDDARLEVVDVGHSEVKLRYTATLTASDGTARHTSGTASRKVPMFGGTTIHTADLLDENITESIAAMYEQIAKELLVDLRPPVPTCVPGQSTSCVGPKACPGYQVCASDGMRYGACTCGG